LAQPSIAGILRVSELPCRAGFASRRRSKFCEFGERSKYREAQGTRVAGKPPDRVSFGYFSLAEQRKVPRPAGRNPDTRKAPEVCSGIQVDLSRSNSHSLRIFSEEDLQI